MERIVDFKNRQEALENYISFKSSSMKSDKLKDIENYTKKFLDFCKKDLDKVKEIDVTKFINSIDKEYSVSTMNLIKVYLKNFIKWNYPNYSAEFRNLDKLCRQMPRESPYSPEDLLKKEDIEKLVQEENSTFWKTFILVLYYGGFRPIEVSNLRWKNISFEREGAFIEVFATKTKKTFLKYVPEEVSFYLKKLQSNDSEFVFASPLNKDKPIFKKTFYLRLQGLSQKALGRRINPYLLRHSVADFLYNEKKDVKDSDVANQLGHHKSMKETYSHNNTKRLKEKARQMWIEPESLPPEKKHELEEEVEKLKRAVAGLLQEAQYSKTKKGEKFGKYKYGLIGKEELIAE